MSRTAAALCLIGAMVLTGANLPLGKVLVLHVPVYLFALYRFVICAVLLALIVRREDGPPLISMRPRQVLDVVLMALLGMVGFMVLMLEGLRRTSALDAGVITATIPAIVAILGVIFLRDRLSIRQTFSIALAVLGVAVVQVAGAQQGASSTMGNLLVAGAAFCEASFVIFGKRLAPPFRPIRLALAANIAGILITIPLALSDLRNFGVPDISLGTWVWGTWYVLSAGVFSLLLWYRGLPHVETPLAGLAMAALPISAFATTAVFLGENVGVAQLAGAVLVIVAIIVAATAKPALKLS